MFKLKYNKNSEILLGLNTIVKWMLQTTQRRGGVKVHVSC